MKEKEGARRSGCEILVEGEEQEGEGKGEGRLPPSFSGDSSGEETYDDSIDVCRLLSLAISSSELEQECGEDPRSSGGCRGDVPRGPDRPLLISWSTSGSLTTLQNSSRPRKETTRAGSRSLKLVWI